MVDEPFFEPWREPDYLGDDEPRIGVRLADGTRLGHESPFGAPTEPGPAGWSQTGGSGSGLRAERTWWLHPLPEGEHVEIVVAWEEQGVPETSTRLALDPFREAAAREEVLWDPPPPPGEDGLGWFAYAPMSGEAYRSSLAITVDDEEE